MLDADMVLEQAQRQVVLVGHVWDDDSEEWTDIPPTVGTMVEVTIVAKILTKNGNPTMTDDGAIMVVGEDGGHVTITPVIPAKTIVESMGKRIPTAQELVAHGIELGEVNPFQGGADQFAHIRGQRVADVQSNPADYGTGMYL